MFTPKRIILALASIATLACAQPIDIADRLEPVRAEHDLPALTAIVTSAEQTVAIGAVGVRQLGDPTPVTTDDLWHLGSCTKSMTGTLAAVLVEQGKIGWGTTVEEVFGQEFADISPGYRGATLEQLLCHRAGVPGAPPPAAWSEAWKQRGTVQEQRTAFVQAVLAAPPARDAGTEFEYSNQGTTIAGAMLERAAGKAWEDLVQEELFRPLGITSAGFGPPGSPDAVDQPRGHTGNPTLQPVPPGRAADNPPAISPAGRVHMTMEDWARYVREHLRGRQGLSELLAREAFEHLHADPRGSRYGMGWGLAERGWGGKVITHAGSNTMWFCVVWAAPEKGFAVLVATNCAGETAAKAADEAAGELIQAYVGGEF